MSEKYIIITPRKKIYKSRFWNENAIKKLATGFHGSVVIGSRFLRFSGETYVNNHKERLSEQFNNHAIAKINLEKEILEVEPLLPVLLRKIDEFIKKDIPEFIRIQEEITARQRG